eukprot:gnl/MRDRNA2_/MRDRNA2_85846_c0_seq1.p1 gnl/MRDRNA2_/MRDRNA2_85846_c0~~gnl/MRDRNA2_/MRDRNA2_85846_c0_seq1.p1  ORF type:complete len:522 (+),score=87.96 gnl/MRDRNA2_/MRDRNA2_85846_c0_seq1:57-1568(+)
MASEETCEISSSSTSLEKRSGPLSVAANVVDKFQRLALARVRKRVLAERKQEKKQKRAASISRFGHVDVEQFMKETHGRVFKQQAEENKVQPGARPARVAIIGAGPVGLWAAVLICRDHARLFTTSTTTRIAKAPLAPVVNVYERRTVESGYGTRRVTLAMASQTQDLLNAHLMSARSLTSQHNFTPACSINLIESLMREEFEKYVAAGFGSFNMGEVMQEPEILLENHDVVLVASGKAGLTDAWRSANRMEMQTGRSDDALIFKFSTDQENLSFVEVEAMLGRTKSRGHPTVFLRCGATSKQGWVWLLGINAEIAATIRSALATSNASSVSYESFGVAWTALTGEQPPPDIQPAGRGAKNGYAPRKDGEAQSPEEPVSESVSSGLTNALGHLDKLLKPEFVSVRITTASFWRSEEVVKRVERSDGSVGWIVLVGDAACGKPFYLGSTLNGHFHDAVTLRAAPWTKWVTSCSGSPFKRYIERIQRRTEGVGFRVGKVSSKATA